MNIYPTLKCNLACNFCMNKLIENKPALINHTLDLELLKESIKNYPEFFKEASILGGEISLLPKQYIIDMVELLQKNGCIVEIITNGTTDINSFFDFSNDIKLTVSYNFNQVSNSKLILKNIINCKRDIFISTIIAREIIDDVGIVGLEHLSKLGNVRRLELHALLPVRNSGYHFASEEQMEQIIDFVQSNKKIRIDFDKQLISKSIYEIADYCIDRNLTIMPDGYFGHQFTKKQFAKLDNCMNHIRKAIFRLTKTDYPACNTCEYSDRCKILYFDRYCLGRKNILRKLVNM